jgi:hypothetical protein
MRNAELQGQHYKPLLLDDYFEFRVVLELSRELKSPLSLPSLPLFLWHGASTARGI